MDLAQAMSRERSPFTDSVSAPLRTEDFPEHSQGVSKALEETRRLFGNDPGQGGVSLAHLFGGLLLTNATASKAVGEALREKVTPRGAEAWVSRQPGDRPGHLLSPFPGASGRRAASRPTCLPLHSSAPQSYLAHSAARATTASGTPTSSTSTATTDAFASLIASPHTAPPLTIGIFGSWGKGKSFLLEHIDREIRRRQDENPDANPARARRAVQRLGVQRHRGGLAGPRSQDRREARPGRALAAVAAGVDPLQVELPACASARPHGDRDRGRGGCSRLRRGARARRTPASRRASLRSSACSASADSPRLRATPAWGDDCRTGET